MDLPTTASNHWRIKKYRDIGKSLGNVMGSFGVASPIIFLNMLASASTKSNNAMLINSLDDLKQFINNTNSFNRLSMAVTFFASAFVLTFLNRLYLWPSITSSKKLFTVPYDFYTRNDQPKHHTAKEKKAIVKSMKRWPADVLFSVWSLATSLIFGEIGSKSFSFMGLGGEVAGFFLSFSIHYASRFLSIQYFIDDQFDKNLKLKKHYIYKLEQLKKETCPQINITDETPTPQALMNYLALIDQQWEDQPKDNWRHFWLHTFSTTLGYSLVAFLTVPIFAGFMPECVQGAELLFHSTIGKDADYKNANSFGFGGFATALTWFFYSVNAFTMPKTLIHSIYDCHHHATQGSKIQAAKYAALTMAACLGSYLTSPSFRLVGQHTYTQGYISYLGNYGRVVPGALSTAFIFMLWSHMQSMIHESSVKHQSHHINNNIMDVDYALKLLRQEDTNLIETIETQPLHNVLVEDGNTPNPVFIEPPRSLTSTPPHERKEVRQPVAPKTPPHSISGTGKRSRASQITPSPAPAPAPSPFM
ncbi:MAG: hypothetical protein P1U63_00340 [Coxiellaceae bacterium]|nr:hypothetical protein [Coxiellaceae bacterium]